MTGGSPRSNAGQDAEPTPPLPYVGRRLAAFDEDGTRHDLGEAAVAALPTPIVVQGDPGMGKTELLLKLRDEGRGSYFTAARFLRLPLARIPEGTLLLDALDELAVGNDDDPIAALLTRLGDLDYPDFVLTCRAADWQGQRYTKALALDYGANPTLLTLLPIAEEEALAQLSALLDTEEEASTFYGALVEHGLDELLGNPQSLRMLLEIARDGVPKSRADLFERAASKMIAEHNPEHVQARLNSLAPATLLDGAGAAMALLLLTGKEYIHTGLQAETPLHGLHPAAVGALPMADAAVDALKSRLFRTTGEPDCLTYCHRTVAEYLGARWLGRVVAASQHSERMARRLLALIRPQGKVPPALRGLHGWLARSPWFADAVIAADAYGAVRYGDLSDIGPAEAIAFWDALEHQAWHDPWFRQGDWRRFSARSLVQQGTGPRLAALLAKPGLSSHLRSLLFDLLPGGACVGEMQDILLAVLSDRTQPLGERRDAAAALIGHDAEAIDWAPLLLGLCASGDGNAARLAEDCLGLLGAGAFSDAQIAEIVAAECLGHKTVGGRPGRSARDDALWSIAFVIPVERSAGVLEALAARLPFRGEDDHFQYHAGFTHFFRTLIVKQIPAGGIDAIALWRWLTQFESRGCGDASLGGLIAAWIGGNTALRQAMQRHILLSDEARAIRKDAPLRLHILSHGLLFQEEDLLAILRDLAAMDRADPVARDAFERLVQTLHDEDAWTDAVTAAAAAHAEGDAALHAILHPPRSTRSEADFARFLAEDERRKSAHAKKRAAERDAVLADSDALRDGRGPASAVALTYLGYGQQAYRDLSPVERVRAALGDGIPEIALEGFDAAVTRPLGMTLEAFGAHLVARRGRHSLAWPIVAGVAQRHIQRRELEGLHEDMLLAAFIAKRGALHIHDKFMEGLGDTLDAFAKADRARFKRVLRALIEPQLAAGEQSINGVHYLLQTKPYHDLGVELLLAWFDELKDRAGTDRKALIGALLDAPALLRSEADARVDSLLASEAPRAKPEDRLYWLSLRFLRDFEGSRKAIDRAARDHPDFLWELQRTIGHSRYGDRQLRPVTAAQLAWIFEHFERHWDDTQHPKSSEGSRNPWDAADFLRALLFALAGRNDEASIAALRALGARESGSYGESIRAALEKQRRFLAERQFVAPALAALAAALDDAPPASAADVKAIVLDALARLQMHLSGSSIDSFDLFYDNGLPKDERLCRNALLGLIGPYLPHGIRWTPEQAMPREKRSDAGFRLHDFCVPLEAKLAWNKALWRAGEEQLDRLYASAEAAAAGQGIYLVFWFGDVPGRRIPRSPTGAAPQSAAELEAMLTANLSAEAGTRLSAVVLDLSRKEPSPR